nr:hypothetical protein BaRGS_008774 [Batillaria attramentaria]
MAKQCTLHNFTAVFTSSRVRIRRKILTFCIFVLLVVTSLCIVDKYRSVKVTDYFGDNFTLYTRSNSNKAKCPPLPLAVPPDSNIFRCRCHWEALVQLVPNLIHIKRTAPDTIFGHEINIVHHKSDVARLEAMIKFGGIYCDMDHIVLKPLHEVLQHTVVMGKEESDAHFGNGFFLGKPDSIFLKLWYESYRTFDDKVWAYNSIVTFRQPGAAGNRYRHDGNVMIEYTVTVDATRKNKAARK